MPTIAIDEDSGWAEKVKRRQHRVKHLSWATTLGGFLFAVIGMVWLYVRLLACQMDVPLNVCEQSFWVPLGLLVTIVVFFIIVLWTLWEHGVESHLRTRVSAHRYLSPETIDDEELRSLVADYQSGDQNRFEERIRKQKRQEMLRYKKWRHHSRSGYKQLDKTHQRHVQWMGVITVIVLGALVGSFFFYNTNFPALMAILVAPLSAIAFWFLALCGANNENGPDGREQFLSEVFPAEVREIARRRKASLNGPIESLESEIDAVEEAEKELRKAEEERGKLRRWIPEITRRSATGIGRWIPQFKRISKEQLDAAENAKKKFEETRTKLIEKGQPSTTHGLVGLAFSGGGIRSATFNLGILQGLNQLKIIPFFDYLSTVSGGGYIGSWYSAWRHREKDPKKIFPESVKGERPPAIKHLWLFSNYLSPRKGLLSAEFWRMVGFYMRGLLLNLAALIPFLVIIVLAGFLWDAWCDNRTPDQWLWYVTIVGGGIVGLWLECRYLRTQGKDKWETAWKGLLSTVLFVGVLVAATYLVLWRPEWLQFRLHPVDSDTMWGPAAAMLSALLILSTAFALLWFAGTHTTKSIAKLVASYEEWFSRMIGRLIAMTGVWVTFFGLIAYGSYFMEEWWVKGLAGSVWTASTIFGLLAKAPDVSESGAVFKKALLKLAPYIFLIGLFLGLVWSVNFGLLSVCNNDNGLPCALSVMWIALQVSAVVFIVFGVLLEINEWSLHAFYRDRLIRAYLGASNSNPDHDEVTGKVEGDDIELSTLDPCINGGPYPLINCTLNLVGSEELWSQQRKADLFLFSPKFCGSERTAYRPTSEYADGTLTLGKALAISGAAVSPEMGSSTSAPLAALLTLFNIRLGYWAPTPNRSLWQFSRPPIWLWYLMRELFSSTNTNTNFCYLSDGGHHENLGLYELVKRRCRYIVCCDAGADPKMSFEDLGNVIRKIRADFGIDIEIEKDLNMLRPKDGQRYNQWHHAFGTIRYDMVEPDSPVGMLVYVKASLTGDEPADVLEYAAAHREFPHESTLDQFFSESQFESYRRLGEHVAKEVFRYAQPSL